TSKEPYPVNSDPFTIESSIVVEHSIDPPAPNGERGWYTVAPTITLKMNGTGMITYRFEGDPATTENPYTPPFKIQKTGQVVIYYKGKSSSGVVSAEKTIVIKYDPEAPVIKVLQPAENGTDCIKVKDGGITIVGQVTDINDVEFSINGQIVPVRNGSFSLTVQLAPGQNIYTMVAKDFAGNQSTKRFCVELKNKPPVVVFDEPSFMARVTAIEFPEISPNVHQLRMKLRVKGTTEPGISQITITPLTVPGNIQSVKVNPDGRFDQELVFDAVAGVNELNAELSDSLGNKATQKLMPVLAVDFKLQSGNTTSDLNGIPVTLQSAPYINQGRTMIPFRIMAESMGAKVGYETNPTTKAVTLVTFELGSTKIVLYIGKNTATVTVAGQSRTVKLDAPPVIKNGVTMVPFRFVAENFGAKVSWDGATKTARMVYP
nr:stalk domain-containing protein [Caldisericia bacterium]